MARFCGPDKSKFIFSRNQSPLRHHAETMLNYEAARALVFQNVKPLGKYTRPLIESRAPGPDNSVDPRRSANHQVGPILV